MTNIWTEKGFASCEELSAHEDAGINDWPAGVPVGQAASGD
jgi:hypothetical protein